ncbi:ABC transporter substrate-binding protein [Haloechinothrix sp. YIM 98757]|uniref:ABC transporter substrate-binding protein n=1 Tax=Haloechinothrix aidingensis TaxID=2752311 RepID=A0A838AEY8_9PSEU|nr:ABC transporter substrate-binding protein [Haloechinothrix aidingensis]MBA0127715.1 ABC transporter substrate-binding protein [Haloechinothrix aidingensis]
MPTRAVQRASSIALALAIVLFSGGCALVSGESRQREDPGLELETLRVGVFDSIGTVPLRFGVAQGIFAKEGLDIELVQHDDRAGVLESLSAGEVDVAYACNVTVLDRAADGAPYQFQGEAYVSGPETMALVTLPGTGPGELGDLDEATIAVRPESAAGELTTRSRLETEGIDPGGVTFTELPFDDAMRALGSGEADAAWLSEPDISTAQREFGATLLADTARGEMHEFPMSSYVAVRDTAEANPNTFSLFRNLLQRSQELGSDPPTIRGLLPEFTSIDETDSALVALGSYPTALNGSRLQRVADLMHDAGMLDQRLDVLSLLPESEQAGS